MKELEQVLQRVRIRAADGTDIKLRERVYAVLRVLGAATLSDAPERGCQMSIDEICKRSRKERSTVWAALAEAVRLGLLRRLQPAPGANYATSINLFDIRLVEAAKKSRPYLGPFVIYDLPAKGAKKAKKNATGEDQKMQKNEEIQGFQEVRGVQLLDVQYLDPEVIFKHPPAPQYLPAVDPSRLEAAVTALPPAFPAAPSGGAGGGSGCSIRPRTKHSGVSLLPDVFLELGIFSDFLEKNKVQEVNTHFQHRKKDDERGGVYMERRPKNFKELARQVERAASDFVEVACKIDGLILIDDLTESGLEELKKEGFEMAAIETSQANFQALPATGPGWTGQQRQQMARALAARFGGDANAINARQPHRLPGSLNLKEGGCWVTRLHLVQPGKLLEPAPIDTDTPAPAPNVRTQVNRDPTTGRDNTPSGQDFGRACQLLAGGKSTEIVVREIEGRAAARGKSGAKNYALLTVKNAQARVSAGRL